MYIIFFFVCALQEKSFLKNVEFYKNTLVLYIDTCMRAYATIIQE